MMIEASVSGLFRTVLILIGVFVLLRFLGQVIVAKNNIARERDMKKREEAIAKEKLRAKQNVGKTKILREKQFKHTDDSTVDIDFTDVKE